MSDIKNIKAFPSIDLDYQESAVQNRNVIQHVEQGMSLRDYFANSAMQGIMNSNHGSSAGWQMIKNEAKAVAKYSYEMADEMLKQREKQ